MLHQIGVGALGPVFRTYEPTRDRLVAVKVFRLDITPEQAQALADELARAAEAGLFHSAIVEPIAAGVEGTVAYRAEEYVAAESLDVAMRHYAPASLDTVTAIVGQLAEAVDTARAAGVGHGALHPRDIFVTPDEARVSGFGVVDALERTGLRAPVRRPYSAPERVAGEAWSTPADVFSLAAIAYELLTARRPSGTGAAIGPLTGAVVPDAGRIQGVLARAMDDDQARRYQSARELVGALRSGVEPEIVAPALPVAPAGPAPEGDIAFVPIPAEEPMFADEDDAGAAEAAAAGAVAGEQPAAGAEPEPEIDDIDAERDEDEAQYALSREEFSAAAREQQPGAGLFDQSAVEAAADDLVFDAADLALTTDSGAAPAFGDEPHEAMADREPPEPPARVAPVTPAPRLQTDERPSLFESARYGQAGETEVRRESTFTAYDRMPFETAVPPERSRPAILPIAVTLILGLLLGFAAGYVVAQRQQPPETIASAEPAPPAQPADQQAQSGQPAGTRGATRDLAGPATPTPSEPAAAAPVPSRTAPPRPSTPAPAPKTGTLAVRSTPAGASVSLNGRWRGRTPLDLSNLSFGKYALRIVLPGHEVKREEVTLSAGDPTRAVSVQLERQPSAASRQASAAAQAPPPAAAGRTGTLNVDSRPAGAQIVLDGKPIGVTPMRIPEVAAGSHVVRLELADHRTWTETAQVTPGKTTRVAGSLEPIR